MDLQMKADICFDQNEPFICDTYAKQITGENFNDWKRNLLIVLNFEKHSFVLTQPRPPTPAIDAPDRDFVALERWDNSNLSAMCYIRASMSNVLQKQHEEHQTARQIMDNLEEMFGEQTIQAKTDAIKGLMNCRQKVGTPIKEHMMKVMAYLSEAQTNGAEIDSATQLVMVFQTLSKDFDLFQASYNLNRNEMSLTKLMKELQAFENIFKGSGSKAEANNQQPGELRRSGRIIREPDRYMFNGEVFEAESIEHEDPATYKEAMEDVD
ncbi:hypothetical protein TIFTF001_052339, partial [Ficus carica]